ncbi:hypothetical protein [Paraburkholderia sp. J7]|uniref:hypothetical protein n=1 Tax=Paraburkholderia sp. J7 TaxID=2805438 RepID=UPI002AB6FDD6|nr:hypothetical protein [Paraburkholderia sp. J7]
MAVPQKKMSEAQQRALLRYVDIGLNWIKGGISFDDVVRTLGKPEFKSDQLGKIEYDWFPENIMTVSFTFDRENSADDKPTISTFRISVADSVHTNIPYEQFDSLGMQRVARGERLDNIRTEKDEFFSPNGMIDTSGSLPKNYVRFAWRQPLPEDSPYDIYASFGYLGEWINPHIVGGLSNFRNAVDLRDITISRFYLLPEELQQRNEAKRQKYGYMNLRTGSVCPETGLWEGWTETGATDVLQVEKGRKFDVVRTVPAWEGGSCPMIDGRWYWLCSPDQVAGFTWHGVNLRGRT